MAEAKGGGAAEAGGGVGTPPGSMASRTLVALAAGRRRVGVRGADDIFAGLRIEDLIDPETGVVKLTTTPAAPEGVFAPTVEAPQPTAPETAAAAAAAAEPASEAGTAAAEAHSAALGGVFAPDSLLGLSRASAAPQPKSAASAAPSTPPEPGAPTAALAHPTPAEAALQSAPAAEAAGAEAPAASAPAASAPAASAPAAAASAPAASAPAAWAPTSAAPQSAPAAPAAPGAAGADPVILREQVLLQLRKIIDPDLFKDIVTLGFVKDLRLDYGGGAVSLTLELTTPACPVKEQFVAEIERLLGELGWVQRVDVRLSARPGGGAAAGGDAAAARNLRNVSQIVAVASCKGGVGKSSVAVNLAYALRAAGGAVGLVDCDVYGPSLPTLLPLENAQIYFRPVAAPAAAAAAPEATPTAAAGAAGAAPPGLGVGTTTTPATPSLSYESGGGGGKTGPGLRRPQTEDGALVPLLHMGVKLMSYGYFNRKAAGGGGGSAAGGGGGGSAADYAAVRGPIASNLVYQLVTQTDWGTLDYLVLDLPPGTGDIHLTLGQSVPLSCAVMVTTPHQLSVADVEKGIKMFVAMNVPTVAIVENMAVYCCRHCGREERIFGDSRQNEVAERGTAEKGVDLALRPFAAGGGESENGVAAAGGKAAAAGKAAAGGEAAAGSAGAAFGGAGSAVTRMQEQFGIRVRAELPLDPEFAALRPGHGGRAFPFFLAAPAANAVKRAIAELADGVVRECARLRFSSDAGPDLRSLPDNSLELSLRGAGGDTHVEEVLLAPARAVRLACRCAECVDEATGAPRSHARKVPSDVHVRAMKMTGNRFAVRIDWSDGHESLMSFALLETVFRRRPQQAAAAAAAAAGCKAAEAGGSDW